MSLVIMWWPQEISIEGTLITSAMLSERGGNLGDLSAQALTAEEDIVGKIAQRPIRSGSAF
ncbi:hypothetical protein HSBAA_01400 [Vreelandella sulfidaeris]|uniref:SAF domain-containing protein n=1 Tax=Vreelandella sulfidaeris TaxID=115553 RepID=A0A455U5N5_9GAMM|nr:hypothetical protein HSBAA_01400 [Halomonas sulfidaeris]